MSIDRILVPLDGSRLAEAVLPAAASLAQRLGARLLLLHVVERAAPEKIHGEPHLTTMEDARRYLDEHAGRMRSERVDVSVDVHERTVSDVAAAIHRHAHEFDADLIAMCAHGRTNLRHRLMGSIAERILRGGSVPILLRTVRRPNGGEYRLRNLLVPLDFRHDIDAALAPTRVLAAACQSTVTLLAVPEPAVGAATRLLPSASALARELECEGLRRRLDELAQALRSELPDIRTVVRDQQPADAILATASLLPADLIVLVTDAHGGLTAWYDPSIAQKLLTRPDLTLLLIS
ncbi:MAG: universal stress protein [Solirubrobacteraceae bacterium]